MFGNTPSVEDQILYRGGLISELDDAIDIGYLKVKKFVKSGDGEVQVEELGPNEYKLHDYDGTTKSGGIRITNMTNDRFFLFSIKTENTGYFASALTWSTLGSDSTMTFVMGPGHKMEIDVDSEYNNLDVCYIEAAYRTGDLIDGNIVWGQRYKDWDTKHDDEVYITFLGEVTVADLPSKDFTFTAGYDGGLVNFVTEEIGGRFVGYDDGRTSTRVSPYNTVKVRMIPGFPMPTLTRELIPGFPVEYGFTMSEGSIGEGEATSLFPGDNPGPVVSISQNFPSFLYPFTKDNGARYTVMDLAESNTPGFLKAGGVMERAAGNTVDRLGDLPYFRYWGDFVLMTPIVVAAVGTGIVLWFSAPAIVPAFKTTVIPMAKQAGQAVLSIPKGLVNGSVTVLKSFGEMPKAFREGMSD